MQYQPEALTIIQERSAANGILIGGTERRVRQVNRFINVLVQMPGLPQNRSSDWRFAVLNKKTSMLELALLDNLFELRQVLGLQGDMLASVDENLEYEALLFHAQANIDDQFRMTSIVASNIQMESMGSPAQNTRFQRLQQANDTDLVMRSTDNVRSLKRQRSEILDRGNNPVGALAIDQGILALHVSMNGPVNIPAEL